MNEDLMEMQEEVKRAAGCFQAVYTLDVAVIDPQMRYVLDLCACAGEMHTLGTVCDSAAARRTLNKQEIVFVDGTDKQAACIQCQELPKCVKLAAIYYPILLDTEIAGAILVSAYDLTQAALIRTQYDGILTLLGIMQEQIVLNVRLLQERRRSEDMEALVGAALNHLSDGALILDGSQSMAYINVRGQKLLGINARQWAYLKRIKQVQLSFQKRNEDGTEEYLFTMHGTSQRLRCRISIVGGQGREAYKMALFSIPASSPQSIPLQHREEVFCPLDQLIGRSAAFTATVEQCRRTAYSAGCVLIQGETGTGKEVLARSIHWEGPYRDNRFVRIGNNAEFRDLVCRIGLNTGDASAAPGAYMDMMRGSTLYIDEISTFDHYHQDKLLMIIRDSFVCNFKVLCATSCDLKLPIAKGEFHENLYYALGREVIYVPALRERVEDIRLFSEVYMARYNGLNNKHLFLSKELLEKMERYCWLGNLNELESFIAHAVECCTETEGEIAFSDLPDVMRERLSGESPQQYRLDEAEKQMILKCLNDEGTGTHSKTDAARALGISLATLYRKIKQYGIQEKTEFGGVRSV